MSFIRLTKAIRSKELPIKAMHCDDSDEILQHFRPVLLNMLRNRVELKLELSANETDHPDTVGEDVKKFRNDIADFCNLKCKSFWCIEGFEIKEPEKQPWRANPYGGGSTFTAPGVATVMFDLEEDLELFAREYALMKKLSS